MLMAQTLEKVFLERLALMPHEEEKEKEEKEKQGSSRPTGRAKKRSSTGENLEPQQLEPQQVEPQQLDSCTLMARRTNRPS